MSNLRFESLDPGPHLAPFLTMTFPAHWPYLLDPSTREALVVLACREGDEACGLALAGINLEAATARLFSLYVAPGRRNQGLGRALMAQLEPVLRQRNVTEVSASYAPGQAGIAPLERILRNQGWSQPTPGLMVVRAGTDSSAAFRASPRFRRQRLPAGYEYVNWSESAQEEKQIAFEWIEQGVAPAFLNPFVDPELLDPHTSLVLREDGRLVGWLITHQITEHLLRFTSLFVRPEIRVKGLGLCLTLEGLHRYVETRGSDVQSEILCATHAGTPLADFWQRRWLSQLPQVHTTHSVVSGKFLDSVRAGTTWAGRPALFEAV